MHKWSGAPGAYCTECWSESPLEDSLYCPDCWIEEDIEKSKLCPMHQLWYDAMKTCPPDPELVEKLIQLNIDKLEAERLENGN